MWKSPLMRRTRQSRLLTTLAFRCLRKTRDTFPTSYVVVQYIYKNMLQIWAWGLQLQWVFFSHSSGKSIYNFRILFQISFWVSYWQHWICAASAKRGIFFQRHMWSCNTYTKICYKFEPEACNCSSGSFSPTVVGILITSPNSFQDILLSQLRTTRAASAKRGVFFLPHREQWKIN